MKAIALLSGGLDSTLAAKLMLEQGIELEGLHFFSIFNRPATIKGDSIPSKKAARWLGIPHRIIEFSKDQMELVKRPKHGHGKNMNPCIDCRGYYFRRAGEYMRQHGASFIVTGEVLGQRPMSQRMHPMLLIERESGLSGLVVRPLCAAFLDPSVPEQQGWLDRKKLLAIQGRGRHPQMELARRLGLSEYPSPAGGCLLTDPGYSARLRDLLEFKPDFDLNDAKLMRHGRYVRLSDQARLSVGRNMDDNERIINLARAGDVLLQTANVVGPTALLRGKSGERELSQAAAMTASWSDAAPGSLVSVVCTDIPGRQVSTISTIAQPKDVWQEYLVQ